MLLLLLGFCLRRRLHGRARKQIARDVNGDPEAEASAQDATDSAEAGVEPWPELVADSRPVARDGGVDSPLGRMTRPPFQQDRVKASRLTPRVLWPIRLPHAGMLSGRGMLSSAAAKEVTDGSDRARSPAAPKAMGPKPGQKPNPARTAAASVLATVEEAGNRSKPTALPADTYGLTLPTSGLLRAYRPIFCVRRRSQHLQSIGSRSEEMARASSPRRWKRRR